MKKLLSIPVLGIAILVLFSACEIQEETMADTSSAHTSSFNTSMNSVAETVPDTASKVVTNTTAEKAVFEDYSEEKYSSLLGNKAFAIFFHADWCPTCRQMEEEINADLASASPSLPDGTIILKANFDTESKLKQKYGIIMQSTVIILNAQGDVVDTLSAPSVSELKQKITSSL